MIRLGNTNTLPLLRRDEKGGWFDAEQFGEIFLPLKQLPRDAKSGDLIKLFIYLDSDDELIASIYKPFAEVGDFVSLKVVTANRIGAFLDWGLKKDLFVPAREQAVSMVVGHHYVVHLYLDRDGRVAATSKFEHFLDTDTANYRAGDSVSLLPCENTPLGIKAIVDGRHWGVLYRNEVFGKIQLGREIRGYIKQIREDGKLDLTLNQGGAEGKDKDAEKILSRLTKQGGYLPVADKSSPEQISQLFTMSKGAFKRAIGALYKQGKIDIEDDGIRLRKPESSL